MFNKHSTLRASIYINGSWWRDSIIVCHAGHKRLQLANTRHARRVKACLLLVLFCLSPFFFSSSFSTFIAILLSTHSSFYF